MRSSLAGGARVVGCMLRTRVMSGRRVGLGSGIVRDRGVVGGDGVIRRGVMMGYRRG